MKTRFAPSPTGWMHFGNVRTALFNFLFARQQQGSFLLRVEDTDRVRSADEFLQGLLVDLQWLQLDWNEGPYKQSERSALYDKYYQELENNNFAYPCFCSDETLELTRKVQAASGQPPRYAGTCRNLSKEIVQQRLNAGESATLRFAVMRDQHIEFHDLVKGQQKFATNDIGDFIIRRNDGSASFMFCNAIDDATMQVTHALRGDDHLTNTPRQIMILRALNLPHPQYGHFAMINGTDGTPLSKRNGSQSVRELREQGYHPLAVINYLARLGHYYAQNEFMSVSQLSELFALTHINTAPARHDISHLRHWQKEAILHASLDEILNLITPYLKDTIPADKKTEFAALVRENILMPSDVTLWIDAVAAPKLKFSDTDKELLIKAGKEFFISARNAVQNNSNISFKELVDIVKEQTGCKGKELFMPLRIALTGQNYGPELAKLMAFMKQQLVIDRFNNVIRDVI